MYPADVYTPVVQGPEEQPPVVYTPAIDYKTRHSDDKVQRILKINNIFRKVDSFNNINLSILYNVCLSTFNADEKKLGIMCTPFTNKVLRNKQS